MKKFLTAILIIALVAALGGLYMVNQRRQTRTSEDLKARAAATGENVSAVSYSSESDGTGGGGTGTETAQTSSGQASGSASSSAGSDEDISAGSASGEDKSDDTGETGKASGISIRGDSYDLDGAGDDDSYAAHLEELLAEAGDDIPVENNTVDMAGTLTQMTYAGVSSSTITDYINDHQNDAALVGATPKSTDVLLRDGITAQENRDDLDYVPVIFMGYYGGWNDNVDELIEQQQLILDTYDQQDKYIIVGLYPNGWTDTEGYDTAMERAWGDHYLQMNDELTSPAMSSEGRTQIAQAIFDKLGELRYI